MGRAKKEHIAAIAGLLRVSQRWRELYGHAPEEEDVERMYAEFLPLQKETLSHGSDVIPGVVAAVEQCRARGLKIGSTTGYTRKLMSVVVPLARQQGYVPDVVVCADDVSVGRPAPWMNFRAAEQLAAYPMRTIVAVDDTLVGIAAGRNADMWTVGVAKTGNALGLSEAELARVAPDKLLSRLAAIREEFTAAGAHYVIDTVSDIPAILDQIQDRLERGEQS